MDSAQKQFVSQALTLGTDVVPKLLTQLQEAHKSGRLEEWQDDLWNHLLAELLSSFMSLMKSSEEKNMMAASWMARNILELSVWVSYCAASVDNAQQFYGDKGRDAFELLDELKAMLALHPQTSGAFDVQIDQAKARISKDASAQGIDGLEESFLKVHNAAGAVGLSTIFRTFNKLFSKFAHPTAMVALALYGETAQSSLCDFCLVSGAGFVTASVKEFERYVHGLAAPPVSS